MTRVDFYAVSNASPMAKLDLVCRVMDKARKANMRVHVLTEDPAQTKALDDRLWTWNESSFFAHETSADEDCAITLGHDWSPEQQCEVLINLQSNVPDIFSRYDRLAECIDGDETCRHLGRERYKFYRDRGYEPNFHELDR